MLTFTNFTDLSPAERRELDERAAYGTDILDDDDEAEDRREPRPSYPDYADTTLDS